jgi:hypothetical protein
MTLFPNPIAARCLAVLSSSTTDAWLNYQLAYSLIPLFTHDESYERISMNLVNEMAVFLLQTTWYDEFSIFLGDVEEKFGWLDAVLRLKTTLLIYQKNYDAALNVEKKARAVSEYEKHEARMGNPIPRNIGCNKGSKYCLNYW